MISNGSKDSGQDNGTHVCHRFSVAGQAAEPSLIIVTMQKSGNKKIVQKRRLLEYMLVIYSQL
jgi:hypothetical protein